MSINGKFWRKNENENLVPVTKVIQQGWLDSNEEFSWNDDGSSSGKINKCLSQTYDIVYVKDEFTSVEGGLWYPSQLEGLRGWYDAADETTIIHENGSVRQWNDKSRFNQHLVQDTGSAQPTTGTTTLNGKNVLNFSDSLMSADFNLPSDGNFSITILLYVDYVPNSFAGALALVDGDNDLTNFQIVSGLQTKFNARFVADIGGIQNHIDYTPTTSIDNQYVIITTDFNFDEGELLYSVDSATTPYTSSNYDSKVGSPDDILYVGGNRSGVSRLGGQYLEFVVSGANGYDNRTKTEGYLAHKWGLLDTLPLDHPYKTQPPIIT